ncbi:hypothetical protein [Pedobacter helvus]|uniref:Peptidylprolyl isomerase n=1 Tax=Pedobacter helvus TaxID=2563444 RepID=A0ABW9JQU3_9SPHI|nr:hypothetical protein [Pedobacter ureilyticus]
MKKAFLVLFFTAAGSILYAQNVATINDNPISCKEFLWVYKKNHVGETSLNQKDLAAYLELYINFKLKVAEAKALGLDADATYKEEIAGYEEALKAQKKVSVDAADYAYLMNEYREGVLMFNLCEQKIWGKAQDDDDKLRAFYANNIKNYQSKPFEEVRGQVVGDYQEQLEATWVDSLRSKYKIKINQAELKKLAKN